MGKMGLNSDAPIVVIRQFVKDLLYGDSYGFLVSVSIILCPVNGLFTYHRRLKPHNKARENVCLGVDGRQ